MTLIISAGTALLVALIAYRAAPIPTDYWVEKVTDKTKERQEAMPLYRAWLSLFAPLVKYTPARWVDSIHVHLYWVQIEGRLTEWTVSEIIALHVGFAFLGGLLGLLYSFLLGTPLYVLAGMTVLPFLVYVVLLSNPSTRIQRRLGSELAEFVSLLSAEAGAGTSLDVALSRLANSSNVCAVWFRRVLSKARGTLLFTKDDTKGKLYEEAVLSRHSHLIGLALNLDNIAKRDTGTQALLEQTAKSVASEYINSANLRAERLGSDIIIPMILFFFLPYMLVIGSILAVPFLEGTF